MSILSMELWLEVNEDDLAIEAAETGMDRELDFDGERWREERYEEYIASCRRNEMYREGAA